MSRHSIRILDQTLVSDSRQVNNPEALCAGAFRSLVPSSRIWHPGIALLTTAESALGAPGAGAQRAKSERTETGREKRRYPELRRGGAESYFKPAAL